MKMATSGKDITIWTFMERAMLCRSICGKARVTLWKTSIKLLLIMTGTQSPSVGALHSSRMLTDRLPGTISAMKKEQRCGTLYPLLINGLSIPTSTSTERVMSSRLSTTNKKATLLTTLRKLSFLKTTTQSLPVGDTHSSRRLMVTSQGTISAARLERKCTYLIQLTDQIRH